ncbi:tyrosine-protein phosphatase [uncultured Robinsoniella sp.]|uniref:tyrosine-protein phosphatase n=1 Tax=uncultured Robinsoniella sp. TaxID=904190 RepID=UPI00374E305B
MGSGQRIMLKGAPNTRDLGGYETKDGRVVKSHKLIRSGALYHLTEKDKEILTKEFEVKTDVDFRSRMEADQKPDPQLPGVRYEHIPIIDEAAAGITRENVNGLEDMILKASNYILNSDKAAGDFMKKTYWDLVTNEFSIAQYRKFFEVISREEQGAVLWHCSVGKDRAGVGTVLVLLALGVPRETILEDYLLTNQFLKEETQQLVEAVAKVHNHPELLKAAAEINGVCRDYLDTVFQALVENWGSADQFLEEKLGLTSQKRENWIERFTELPQTHR